MIQRFFSSVTELKTIYETLKQVACPFCKGVGSLIRYGFLHGYDETDHRQKSVRARRVFCNNRKARNNGCGRTFSLWAAEKLRRLSLNAGSLWNFLQGVASGKSKLQAFRDLSCMLSDSAPYRIWKRFEKAQTLLRTVLSSRCPPPDVISHEPRKPGGQRLASLTQVIAHLEAAFPKEAYPISAFQRATQSFFLP